MQATPEKKPVRVNIYNNTYSLLYAGDPSDLETAANEVDELMTTIAKAGNYDSTRIAVLACLHLQERLQTLERDLRSLKSLVDDRTRHLSVLLDQVIEEDTEPTHGG
ncbi:MAG TPA: cell division protein ZapA [Bryobacteraceae bacterium]|nr:cell division protein ZapA [Bryobacteraceae bacterium]